jgi:formate dehydrogenase iron-sulfur subunit
MTEVHARAREHTPSELDRMIPDESELTAGVRIEPGRSYGFFTDTTLCIGCKACEVACKEWNSLPADDDRLSGMSYDNTRRLSSTTWRHVAFIEKEVRDNTQQAFQGSWLMLSDVCKHCSPAPCLEACPTGAIFRTEFDTVVVQQDICNGCGYCVPACPFGVVAMDDDDGKAHKCTLCYDRMKGGLEPACAKSCPTDSIQFGEVEALQAHAEKRVQALRDRGVAGARLYGTPGAEGATGGIRHLNASFLLLDRPEVYNLPAAPSRPAERIAPALGSGLVVVAGLALAAFALLGGRR